MKNKLVLLFILLIIIPSALAVSVTYTYTTVSSGVNAVVYKISDNSKFGDFSSGATNKITINYEVENPFNIYNTYHYKQGYLPYKKTLNSDSAIGFITKQPSCQAVANVVVPASAQANTNFNIQVSFNKIFTDLDTSSFPSELEEYYKTDIKVDLYIDGVLSETKQIKVLNTGDSTTFTKSLATAGNHLIKIKTSVTDDQCQNKQEYSSLDYTISITSTSKPQSCPTCSEPTAWSTCTNSQRTRTNYTCSPTTNYQCQSYTETQSCTQPPSGACGADKECKKDKTVCTSGDPDCSCSQLNGYLCKENELCLPGNSLTHEDSGTCCSTICIPPQEPCTQEELPKMCTPDSFGCIMIKECEDGNWGLCKKTDPLCHGSADCSDGTKSGLCSESIENVGKVCIYGKLQQFDACITPSNQTCDELWDCASFLTIGSFKTCRQWIDMYDCGTYVLMPRENQTFSLDYKTPYQEYIESTLLAPSIITEGQAPKPEENKETVITQILDKLGIPFPRNLSVKVGFEYPIVLFVIAAVIAAFALYLFNHNPLKKIKIPQPKISQKTKSPVKPTDLLISVIESLKGDERRLADKLLEDEGITVEEMRKKLGLTKTKMDIALTKLERRQLLKERKDYNDGLYFNDWLK